MQMTTPAIEIARTQDGALTKSGRFLWHLLQMIAAMAVGMAIYVGLFRLIFGSDAYEARRLGQPLLWYGEMAVFMTIPMIALMRRHRYSWQLCLEMGAAMVIPPAALVALVQLGLAASLPSLSAQTLSAWTHGAMLLGMLGTALYRRAEYSAGAHHHTSEIRRHEGPPGGPGPLTEEDDDDDE